MEEGDLLREQVEYYRARAAEYDEWFLREGRYDRGPEHRARWFREVAIVEAALQKTLQSGEVLELACGTGLWTQHLVKQHSRVVAVDASPEAIAINRNRSHSGAVEYIVADLFNWTPPTGRFDAVFFGFWLSHVPPGHFDAFWETVRMSLKPNGQVFFVDSLLDQTSTARSCCRAAEIARSDPLGRPAIRPVRQLLPRPTGSSDPNAQAPACVSRDLAATQDRRRARRSIQATAESA